jgi:hypothetical protein
MEPSAHAPWTRTICGRAFMSGSPSATEDDRLSGAPVLEDDPVTVRWGRVLSRTTVHRIHGSERTTLAPPTVAHQCTAAHLPGGHEGAPHERSRRMKAVPYRGAEARRHLHSRSGRPRDIGRIPFVGQRDRCRPPRAGAIGAGLPNLIIQAKGARMSVLHDMRALHLHTPMGTGRLTAGVQARTGRNVSRSLDEYSCTRQFVRYPHQHGGPATPSASR